MAHPMDPYTTAPAIGKDETLLIQGSETIAYFVCDHHELIAKLFAELANEEMDASPCCVVSDAVEIGGEG